MEPLWIAIIGAITGSITGAIAGGIVSYYRDKQNYNRIQMNLFRDSLLAEAQSFRDAYGYEDGWETAFEYPGVLLGAQATINRIKPALEDAMPELPEDDPHYAKLVQEALFQIDEVIWAIDWAMPGETPPYPKRPV